MKNFKFKKTEKINKNNPTIPNLDIPIGRAIRNLGKNTNLFDEEITTIQKLSPTERLQKQKQIAEKIKDKKIALERAAKEAKQTSNSDDISGN